MGSVAIKKVSATGCSARMTSPLVSIAGGSGAPPPTGAAVREDDLKTDGNLPLRLLLSAGKMQAVRGEKKQKSVSLRRPDLRGTGDAQPESSGADTQGGEVASVFLCLFCGQLGHVQAGGTADPYGVKFQMSDHPSAMCRLEVGWKIGARS